ncbi:MAG: energy transducer TonB [Verrucomicrobiota bacterium]|nr:energy transducer TonB [Verrucomicrobiota bacterium]
MMSFFPSCEKEPEEIHVFELASTTPTPMPKPQTLPKAPPPPQAPPPPKKIIEKPSPVKIAPKPKPTSKPTPKTTKPKPKLLPKPVPKPQLKTQPKSMSIEEFRKTQKLPSLPKPRPPVRNIQPIKLNPQDFSLPKIKISSPENSTPMVSPGAINQYLARVKAKLEGIWRKLLVNSSLGTGGEARLSFRISPNGALISPRISKSSGNTSLDRLVMEVAQRGGVFGPPPGGRLDSVLEIPFRVQ